MSSPYDTTFQHGISADFGFDGTIDANEDIPRRVMRVKVLYTFDNDNKTHCLARLVRPVPIQVVALDDTTEIGVVELRTCIQAIVAASPEMIAKLENDYTVYAYDYSEYETPLVGQGMLSYVLASASQTPNAPARDSGTMVTGRVCKNIMGLFASGGIRETLEVKLKLVPVPTRSKREYLQSMAVYRDPSILIPEGFDNNAWNSFLQAIPDPGAIREGSSAQPNMRAKAGGVEQLHDMLTPNFGPEDDLYSNAPGSSRPASPTPSQRSMSNHPAAYHGSRPASRASFHQPQPSEFAVDDQGFEDGPAKKRARLMQTDWHGRGSFGAQANSLREAVSTSASLRNFRPSVAGNSSAGIDMIPRAPTPRAGEKRTMRPGMPRAGSSLRRQSTGGLSPYSTHGPDLSRNDSGIYSNDYDAGSSRHGSPSPDLPSSPPEYTPIEPPSSPLPELPQVPDSGFQSDLPNNYEPKSSNMKPPLNVHLARKARGELEWAHMQPGPQENLPTNSFPHFDPLSQKSAMSAQWHKTPTSPTTQPAHRRGGRAASKAPQEPLSRQPSATPLPFDEPSPSMYNPVPSIENTFPLTRIEPLEQNLPPPAFNLQPIAPGQQDRPQRSPNAPLLSSTGRPHTLAAAPVGSTVPPNDQQPIAPKGPASANYILEPRKNDPVRRPGTKVGRAPKRALKKAQSWAAAGSSDIDSDCGQGSIAAANQKSYLKGGSGAVRSMSIHNQLQSSLASGAPVRFCCNCGEIKTPTWRPYWLRVEEGDGEDIILGNSTGIHMVEPVEANDEGKTIKYRVYKQYGHLTNPERKAGTHQQYYFCNPCGDYIRKYAKMRPRFMWDPAEVETGTLPKKRGPRRKKKGVDGLTSDLPMPSSEWDISTPYSELPMFTDPFDPSEAQFDMPPSEVSQPTDMRPQLPVSNRNMQQMRPKLTPPQQVPFNDEQRSQIPDTAEFTALRKAIQSSPARNLVAQQDSLAKAKNGILTPKPTRRLLFPSPRKDGEFKSLDAPPSNKSQPTSPEVSCLSFIMNNKQNIARHPPDHNSSQTGGQSTQHTHQTNSNGQTQTESSLEVDSTLLDKENCPPPIDDDDDFAHLFEEGIFATPGKFKTPSKAVPRTPNSKSKRNALSTGLTPRGTGLTPGTGSKRSAECMGPPETPTPTKLQRRSPRLAEKNGKEMTPFTRSLNQFLSDGLTSSPSKAFNWTLTSSPAKNLSSTFGDMAAMSRIAAASSKQQAAMHSEDTLWSEFPMPSSPPFFAQSKGAAEGGYEGYNWDGLDMALAGSVGVDVWEDGTATEAIEGTWEGIFVEEQKAGVITSVGLSM